VRDRKSGLATVPIGAASFEQVADLFAEPSKDARLGLADGHGGHPEPGGEGGKTETFILFTQSMNAYW
jgi:hypothetical protein